MVARLATRRGRVRCLARAEGTRRCGAGTGSIGHVRAVGVPLLQRPAAVTADSAPPTSDVAIWQSSPSTHNPAAPRRRSKSQPRAVEQDAMRRKDPSFASLSTTSARVFDGPGGCWLIEKQQRLPRRIAETKSSNRGALDSSARANHRAARVRGDRSPSAATNRGVHVAGQRFAHMHRARGNRNRRRAATRCRLRYMHARPVHATYVTTLRPTLRPSTSE